MTFFSVIEYGAVSYIHRYNERMKKKQTATNTTIENQQIPIVSIETSSENLERNQYQNRKHH